MSMINIDLEIAKKTHNGSCVTLIVSVITAREETHQTFMVRHTHQGELVNRYEFSTVRHALNKFDAVNI